jgi:hypothetical protein
MTSRMHTLVSAELAELPLTDVHSHLAQGRAALSDPAMLLSYHMLQYPLRAADGGELDPHVLNFGREADPETVYELWERCGQAVMDTGFGTAFTSVMQDLYGFRGPLNRKGLRQLAKAMKERADDPAWPDAVFDRIKVGAALTSAIGMAPSCGPLAGRLQPTVESGVLGMHECRSWQKCLVELERRHGKEITCRADMDAAIRGYLDDHFNWTGKRVYVSWVSTLADFRPTTTAEIDRIIGRCRTGKGLTHPDVGLLVGEQIRSMVRTVSDRVAVCQLCIGCQYLHEGTEHPLASGFPDFIHSLGYLVAEFPDLHFNMLNAIEGYEHSLCAMVQAYGNVSLGGYWWHMFYPTVMENAWHRRFDMVPATRLMGFFSDGYCVDHVYARATMTRAVLARVLAGRIERGLCTRKTASRLARAILVDTPRRIMLGEAS